VAGAQNIVLYGQTPPPSGATTGDFNLTASNVNVNAVTTDSSGNALEVPYVVVTVSGYTFTMLSPYVSGPKTGKPIVASLPIQP